MLASFSQNHSQQQLQVSDSTAQDALWGPSVLWGPLGSSGVFWGPLGSSAALTGSLTGLQRSHSPGLSQLSVPGAAVDHQLPRSARLNVC